MHSLLDLHLLVDKFAAALPDLNLDAMNRRVQHNAPNQLETGEPGDAIVNESLDWLNRFSEERLSPIRAIAV